MQGGLGGGPGARAHQEKSKACNGSGPCTVDVKKSLDNPMRAVVDPEYVIVNNRGNSIHIFFDPKDSLTIESIDFGDTEFECMAEGMSGRWNCFDKHAKGAAVYKYTVKVKDFPLVDPWVVND